MSELLTSTAPRSAGVSIARTTLAIDSDPSVDPAVSFEFFPPKTPVMEAQLWHTVERLAVLRPSFMSVTYGAGGSTHEGTQRIVRRIQTDAGTPAAAHLTCVGASEADIDAIAESYWASGIRHLVALRGDPVGGLGQGYRPRPDGYPYADALVRGLRGLRPFEISVAAYPEVHPHAASPGADLDALKRKIDAGATRAISQFFFDADVFARFVERARKAGIEVPIVPGILPVINYARAVSFAKACNVTIPAKVHKQFEGTDDYPRTLELVAATVAADQCFALQRLGIRDFHFYTLNRAELSFAVCHMLGVRPARAPTN
jgi:methylenetetrahydrofolate reductase (NADPH)